MKEDIHKDLTEALALGKEIIDCLQDTIRQYKEMYPNPPVIAVGVSYAMYSVLKRREGGMTAGLMHVVPLMHFSAFGAEGYALEITSDSMLYAVKKVDENYIALGINSPGMLKEYMDVYEEQYNTRLGALYERHQPPMIGKIIQED